MSDRQAFILVVCRADLDPSLIPPLKTIIPLFYGLMPIRIFTSDTQQIEPKVIPNNPNRAKSQLYYDQLVYHLQNVERQCNLTETLKKILDDYIPPKKGETGKNINKSKYYGQDFRICLLGSQHVNWNIIMQYKRNNIVIDTAGTQFKTERLVQISYITGGIHKQINQKKMMKSFLCDFQMDLKTRKMWVNDQKHAVQFSLECYQCKDKIIKQDFLACSVCLTVYCNQKHDKSKFCSRCSHHFD